MVQLNQDKVVTLLGSYVGTKNIIFGRKRCDFSHKNCIAVHSIFCTTKINNNLDKLKAISSMVMTLILMSLPSNKSYSLSLDLTLSTYIPVKGLVIPEL